MKVEKLIMVIFCIILPLALLLLSFNLVISFYHFTADQQDGVDFLLGKTTLREGYTMEEIAHMQDVKEVIQIANLFFLGILVVLVFILTYYQRNKMQLKRLFRYGGITTLSFVGLILLFILTIWNFIFTIFHKIFFPQGNWQFPADSLLITTYPGSLFVKLSLLIFIGSLFFGSIFILLSKSKRL